MLLTCVNRHKPYTDIRCWVRRHSNETYPIKTKIMGKLGDSLYGLKSDVMRIRASEYALTADIHGCSQQSEYILPGAVGPVCHVNS